MLTRVACRSADKRLGILEDEEQGTNSVEAESGCNCRAFRKTPRLLAEVGRSGAQSRGERQGFKLSIASSREGRYSRQTTPSFLSSSACSSSAIFPLTYSRHGLHAISTAHHASPRAATTIIVSTTAPVMMPAASLFPSSLSLSQPPLATSPSSSCLPLAGNSTREAMALHGDGMPFPTAVP